MGFNEIERFHLDNKNFIAAYDDTEEVWRHLAEEAYAHTSKHLETCRPGDVACFLVPALKINDDFREILSEKGLRANYWYEYFADLILDRTWEDLVAAASKGSKE